PRRQALGRARAVLLLGLIAAIAGIAIHPLGTRLFWTVGLPLLPVAIVVFGFHWWRNLCPLAAFQLLGGRLRSGERRRVGAVFERHSYLVSLGQLAICLAVRLLLTNGDHRALAIFLGAICAAAFLTGAVFTGKSWCNFFCP